MNRIDCNLPKDVIKQFREKLYNKFLVFKQSMYGYFYIFINLSAIFTEKLMFICKQSMSKQLKQSIYKTKYNYRNK